MPHLVLINPSNKHKGLGNRRYTAWPPLNLPYLGALTPSHYTIQVIDENISPFNYVNADIVGITSYTASVTRGYEIAQIYKKKGITTVMGGIHVSMLPEEALNYCDTVVIGEAEDVWQEVLKDFENGNLQRLYRGSWIDLHELPMAKRDILQNEFYIWGSIQTSRGCPMECSFCSVSAFNGRRFRRRPLEDTIDELEQIPQKNVMITDDNIIGYSEEERDWAKEFFYRIIEKRIKKYFFAQTSIQFGEDQELIHIAAKAGLKILFIGIESLNPECLKAYKKRVNLKRLQQGSYQSMITNIRKGGIAVIGGFVLGSDEDNISVFQSTLKFIDSSGIDVLQITKPTPLPGTSLWYSLLKEGRLLSHDFPKAWEDYRLTKMVYKPKKLRIEDLYEGFTYIRIIYYGFFKTIKRTINTLITTKSVAATYIAYKFNMSYRKAFIASEHYNKFKRGDLMKKFNCDLSK